MSKNLGRMTIQRKSGEERLHANGMELEFTVLSFWRWGVSDLVLNTTRGLLAEFIVAKALDVSTDGIRNEWDPYDLETPEGIKIEVRSAAYLQSWYQAKPSTIEFKIQKTKAWSADTNRQELESKRQGDIYVFALLIPQDKSTLDPLNVSQWCFYVLPTAVLDAHLGSQKTIRLRPLERLCGHSYSFFELRTVVEMAAR